MTTIAWIKSTTGTWLPLETVDLSNVSAVGVYVIWHEGQPSRVVRIGQGDIADRLRSHRTDSQILKFKNLGTLRVTWAAVSPLLLDGVERYLADQWRPLVGDAFPSAIPVPVNSPFAA